MSITSRDTAEHYTWGQVCDGWRRLDRPDLSVIEERIPPGAGELRHVHASARQLFFVLSGVLTIHKGQATFTLQTGDSLEVEPGLPHQVRNLTDRDAYFLVISAPSTRGDRMNLA